MRVKGNWGVEIVDTLRVYERPPEKIKIYVFESAQDYKLSCRC
ncbi:MAG: hypothetical protein AABX14_00490 [Candidatus Aenigmatarchaeota archaeon]